MKLINGKENYKWEIRVVKDGSFNNLELIKLEYCDLIGFCYMNSKIEMFLLFIYDKS